MFDDADDVWGDLAVTNMLKAVLDSDEERNLSWVSPQLADEGWDTSFSFTGQIIFISNRRMDQIPQPVRSRSMMVDLTLTQNEIFDRFRSIGYTGCFKLDNDGVDAVVDLLWTNRHSLKELSIRTMGKAAAFYRRYPDDVQDMVSFLL